tara:strand:- start:279 stop:1694 length:1416 start_codon:yes stop_codon:yes gene_type:complete
MSYTLFIFFRDFRIQDNLGLIEAMNNNKNIIPCFIFVDEQINPAMNKYFSHNSVQFLCESLQDLHNNFKKKDRELYIFKSPNIGATISSIHKKYPLECICFNEDYTPYARKRTEYLSQLCNKKNINCETYEDYLLSNIGDFLKTDGTPYGVYTPFRNYVMRNINLISKPKNNSIKNIAQCDELKHNKYYLHYEDLHRLYIHNPVILVKGGRENAKKLLLKTKSMNYDNQRNLMIIPTSRLSAYIKYGNISIREAFWKFHNDGQVGLADQIIWREFYFYVAYYYPEVLSKSKNYYDKYNNSKGKDKIKWVNKKSWLDAWKSGNTGFPIVDACMKELNTTGYMHNRGRLISSNFLNRILGHDWRKGELYFAQKLTDYDPCVNNGNWQWIASTGTDTKPYFQRLFNPWLQSEKNDPQAKYIKKWLPQLKDVPANHLHHWDKYCHEYNIKDLNYMYPIVDYDKERKRSVKQYTEF